MIIRAGEYYVRWFFGVFKCFRLLSGHCDFYNDPIGVLPGRCDFYNDPIGALPGRCDFHNDPIRAFPGRFDFHNDPAHRQTNKFPLPHKTACHSNSRHNKKTENPLRAFGFFSINIILHIIILLLLRLLLH